MDVLLEATAQRQFAAAPRAVRQRLRALARELAVDPQAGVFIPPVDVHRRGTLAKWERRVGSIRNIYKLDLPSGWRALYTIGTRGERRVIMVLEIVDHKQYERLMGYG